MAQLSAQCHKTLPYPCLPGASRSCLSAQCHSWEMGNGRKAAGCGGSQARQPVVLINKAHGHELRGAQRPLGRGQRAGHGGSEQQGWKIPVKPGTGLICAKGKCVHWFLSSIGWQWNLGTESSVLSAAGAKRCRSCISFPVKVLTLIYGSYTLLGSATYGAASLPPSWRGASPAPRSSDSSVWAAEPGCSHRRTLYSGIRLPPSLTELTSAILQDTASSSFFFFFLMPFVLKCCQ